MRKALETKRLGMILTGFLAFSGFLLLLARSDTAIEYMKKGLKLCSEKVIPSLFPFMVISELLVKSGVGRRLGALFGKPFRWLFGVSESTACAFTLGLLCGFPIGASTLCSMVEQGEIGESEAVSAMTFCNNPGSAFVINAVGVSLFGSRRVGLVLYLSVILSAITVGVAVRLMRKNKKSLSRERALCVLRMRKSGTELFTSAVSNSAVSMLTVCAYVTFFSSLLGCLGVILEHFSVTGTAFAAIFGFFEISGGVGMAAEIADGRVAVMLAAAILGWSGLSVHLQISSVCKGRIDLRPYFLAKLAQSLLCTAIACCLSVTVL